MATRVETATSAATHHASHGATRRPAKRLHVRAARSIRRRPGLWLSPLVIPLLAVCVSGIRTAFNLGSLVLPAPNEISRALLADLTSAEFYSHAVVTLQEVVLGFIIGAAAGIVVGSLLAASQFVEDLLYPYLVALQTMPKVAIAPLLVVWLGFGISAKVLIVALIAFFPLMVNVIVGLRAADRDHVEMMRSLRASELQVWRMVRLPGALPVIFAGLQVAMVLAMVGAMVGEFVGASAGLGYLILQRNSVADTAGVYALLIELALMGLLLAYSIRFVGRLVVYWDKEAVGSTASP